MELVIFMMLVGAVYALLVVIAYTLATGNNPIHAVKMFLLAYLWYRGSGFSRADSISYAADSDLWRKK